MHDSADLHPSSLPNCQSYYMAMHRVAVDRRRWGPEGDVAVGIFAGENLNGVECAGHRIWRSPP